jgi:hypothetical protein
MSIRIVIPPYPESFSCDRLWPNPVGEDLRAYTRDGELSIDKHLSERTPRAQALGRRNFLFVGSDRGGRPAATLYSLVGS